MVTEIIAVSVGNEWMDKIIHQRKRSETLLKKPVIVLSDKQNCVTLGGRQCIGTVTLGVRGNVRQFRKLLTQQNVRLTADSCRNVAVLIPIII